MRLRTLTLICSMLFAGSLLATSFVVPTDDELIARSPAIVIGTIEGSYVQETENAIETVYELRVERAIKGAAARSELIRIVSPGGVIGDRGVHVPAAAHFRQGDRVLLFLTRENGRWHPTDMTLGKFRFVISTTGERLLVRDTDDVVGWDHRGQVHREKVRREQGFLRFIEERVRGRAAQPDYEVEASAVTLPEAEQRWQIEATAAFPAPTYTSWVNSRPTRRPNISAGVTFRKRADQNISGLADGGVSVIQNGLASWNNECGSVINLIYGGTTNTPSAHFDGQNVVEFNDPQSRVSGTWSGSGTIAITFNSFSNTHSFAGTTWWGIDDADVVFQNGYPGTHSAFDTAMTHELGHGIGWRHSNQNHQTGGACNSAVEECTSAAIMNSSVGTAFNYTLQPWDINAAQAVYPGGTCGPSCTPPTITAQPQSATVTAGTTRTLSVSVGGTSPFTYQWYTGASGNTASPISGATSSSLTVTVNSTTSYWVRVSNSCGTVNSATATLTVSPPPPTGTRAKLRTDFDGDGRSEIFRRNVVTGADRIWFVNGTTVLGDVEIHSFVTGFSPEAFGDFNGDGRSDIFWRNASTSANYMWLMNGSSPSGLVMIPQATSWNYVASGDFDGDGKFDLFWRNTSSGAGMIWFMNGATVTRTAAVSTMSSAWSPVIADFNGDGRYDILWRNASTTANYMWLMNGASPAGQTMVPMPTRWRITATGDFNADGRFDIWWRDSSTGENRIWLMNGSARTELAPPVAAAANNTVLAGDFNGDRHHDILWHNSGGGTRMWLIVNGRLSSQSSMPTQGAGWRVFGLK